MLHVGNAPESRVSPEQTDNPKQQAHSVCRSRTCLRTAHGVCLLLWLALLVFGWLPAFRSFRTLTTREGCQSDLL